MTSQNEESSDCSPCLLFLFVPLRAFMKKLKTTNDEIKLIATLGVAHILSVMIYGLSQGFLVHNSGTIFYFFLNDCVLCCNTNTSEGRIMKILVIRNDKLGDFVQAFPAFAMLKASNPELKLTALVPAYTAPLAQICPYLDDVIMISAKNDKADFQSSC